MPDDLDQVFKALADQTRRGILDLLKEGPRTTTEIVERFPHLTRFGVMKHLDVLREADLVLVRKEGRKRINSLNAVPIQRIQERWVSRYQRLWTDQMLRLKDEIEGESGERKAESGSSQAGALCGLGNSAQSGTDNRSGDETMSMAEAILGEFEAEAATTRKFLERLPADKLDWKPHEKSMSAGQLALHIATAPGQTIEMGMVDEFTVPPEMGQGPPLFEGTVEDILAAHEASIAKVRERLPELDDGLMMQSWKLCAPDGTVLLEMPRAGFVRTIVMNHWIHHRGQFGVYLRLLGAKVPSSYGPSGDEMPDFMK